MKQNSDYLSEDDVAIVKLLLLQGFQHKRIASLFDVNQGRISEINSGKKHRELKAFRSIIPPTYPLKRRGEDR